MKLSCLLAVWAAASLAALQASAQKSEPEKPASLPESVRHIPPDSLFFMHVRVADLAASDFGRRLLRAELWDKNTEDLFAKNLSITERDVEAVTLLFMPPPGEWDKAEDVFALGNLINEEMFSESLLVTVTKPFDRSRIVRALQSDESIKVLGENVTVLFLSDRTILIGTKANLLRYPDLKKRKESTLPRTGGIKLAAEKHHIVLGAYLSPAMQKMFKTTIQLGAMLESISKGLDGKKEKSKKSNALSEVTFAPILNMRSGAMAITVGKELDLQFQMTGEGKSDVGLAMQAVKTMIAVLDTHLEELEKADDRGQSQMGKAIRRAVRKSSLEQNGDTIHFRATLQQDAEVWQAIADYYEGLGKTGEKK